MTENERIKQIRKAKFLTLEKFGERVGMKKGSLSQVENGINSVSNQLRNAVCREFNVNETWLRTGEGEMFAVAPADEIDELLRKYGLPTFLRGLVQRYEKLPEQARAAVEDMLLEWAEDITAPTSEHVPDVEAQAKAEAEAYYQRRLAELRGEAETERHEPHEMAIEEIHAEIDRQWALEKEAEAESSASGSGSSGMASV